MFDFGGKEVNYSDKDFNEVVANFVRIESVCAKYSFFSLPNHSYTST